MSRGKCAECSGPTEWDENVGSAICIECGTLADPTQSILTTHHDFLPDTAHGPWTTITTSLKNRKGWTLPGQSQDASRTRNTLAIHEFIQTLAMRLSARGAAERAQTLFDQAMARERFRWGRRSKRMAGAALAIALRESKRNDSLRDIAYLLEESPAALGRAFSSLTGILSLSVTPADPTVHLSTLHSHLVSLLQNTPSTFPDKLRTILEAILPRIMTIMQTADSLCALLSRTDVLVKMPPPPTACAVMMLAIEAELKSSLPQSGVLAQSLGSRFGAAKGTVMQRYKIIYDLAEEWIREVPWLDAHERKNGGTGRSKVAKRVVVARGLKDVLQFQNEISAKKMEAQEAMPQLELDPEDVGTNDKEDAEDDPDGHWRFFQDVRRKDTAAGTSPASTHIVRKDDVNSRPLLKKWKSSHERSVIRASQFLLDPLRSRGSEGSGAQSAPPRARQPSGSTDLDLLSHILTADASSLPHVFANAPSRLQLLAASRARAESDIPDEELFADGELDGLLRSAEEAGQLRIALGWDVVEDDASSPSVPQKQGKKRRRGVNEDDGAVGGSKRINMDALAKLLDPSLDLAGEYVFGDKDDYLVDDVHGECADDDNADHAPLSSVDEDPILPSSAQTSGSTDEGEVVEEWRPMSPGGGGYDEDRYL